MGPCLTVFCITIVGSAENCYTMQESTGIEEIARLGTPPKKINFKGFKSIATQAIHTV